MIKLSELTISELECYYNLASKTVDTIASNARINHGENLKKLEMEFNTFGIILDKIKTEVNKRLKEIE